ncbi:2 OG-Fe(II) oxygenase superfamily protein Ofd2 [Schizosaccharomyces cryophilus OY26]|uniref:2 OG-Fe(II) oxygenase superfamily protein Ofd2 n=1 Tax=Schizosaccharomyces cryophilus (strain OY26 / ATCC MYA-4695 / CBS 11777 / NBRC 106824 / NRRL Y48691) TaxID=653667 RepID=S9X609_SCHCR|nr:2 OG-Fe(II) oxygenase superfamily protein Ofd2 [Schizosaccharomyces cryophilus OY26]EPY52537.1 2 OG-Fe(II) oxygenase superfamily protein Ofd2 [Schizosaccharomyces cryophilus OY26]
MGDTTFDSELFDDSCEEENEFDRALQEADQVSIENEASSWTQVPIESIPGLSYYPNRLPPDLQNQIANALPDSLFSDMNSGRQLHLYVPFPEPMQSLNKYLPSEFLSNVWKDQPAEASIIQVYNPGDGIIPHKDLDMFADGVAIYSFFSDITMVFTLPSQKLKCDVRLQKGSLVIMYGPARYQWLHEIPFRGGDWVPLSSRDELTPPKQTWIPRTQRFSITMRRIVGNHTFG